MIQTGVIHGGIARNVILWHCSVECEIRPDLRADADFMLSKTRRFD
jgi:hypothetical protein